MFVMQFVYYLIDDVVVDKFDQLFDCVLLMVRDEFCMVCCNFENQQYDDGCKNMNEDDVVDGEWCVLKNKWIGKEVIDVWYFWIIGDGYDVFF